MAIKDDNEPTIPPIVEFVAFIEPTLKQLFIYQLFSTLLSHVLGPQL